MFYVYADGESIFDPLIDTLSIRGPKVTLELGKSGSFQFSIPQNNRYYNSLVQLKTKIVVELDNTEIFRGRILSISRGFSNIKTVYCEGILSYLVDSVQKARRFKGKAKDLYTKIIGYHNGMVEADKQFRIGSMDVFDIENPEVVIPGKKEDEDDYYESSKYEQAIIESIVNEWQTSYDYINTMFIDYLGGHLIARYNSNNGYNYLDYISNETYDAALESAEINDSASHNIDIEFGVNMLDFSEEASAEDLFTVLIPLGEGEEENLTIAGATASIDNSMEIVSVGGKRIGIAYTALRQTYGTIAKTYVFDNVNNANTLLQNAVKYLRRHKDFPITYTVKAIDLHYINKTSGQIKIGDTVKVSSAQHKINRYLLCTKIEYDLANPANTFYTFGKPEQSLTERYKKNKDKEKKDSDRGDKSGAKGGGRAAGAAGDAAEQAAEDNTNKLLGEFYDAYLTVDKENGKISLVTAYENALEDLKTRSGIDLSSGPEGSSVNIYTMYDDINKAMTSINQLSDEFHAEIESRAEYKTETDTSLASIKQYADAQQSYIDLLAQHDTANGNAIANLKVLADANHAEIESLTKFKTEFSESLTSIRQWASDTFASIKLEAAFEEKANENNREAATHRAAIEMKADKNSASITEHTQSISDNTKSIAEVKVLSNKLLSMIQFTTNYDEALSKSGWPISSRAQLKLTSDALHSAIDSDTNFATYIDGKLMHSTTSIYQFANEHESKIKLIASFSGKDASIDIKAVNSKFMEKVVTQIKLRADEILIDGFLNAKGTALFNRGVSFADVVYFPGGSNITKFGTATFAKTVNCDGGLYVHNANLIVEAGREIKIGSFPVALAKDVVKTDDYTQDGIESKLKTGFFSMSGYLMNRMKGDSASFGDFLKKYITASYIQSCINEGTIKSALGIKSSSGFSTWLEEQLGCKDSNGKVCTLSTYIRNKTKHSHSFTLPGHQHGGVTPGDKYTSGVNGTKTSNTDTWSA